MKIKKKHLILIFIFLIGVLIRLFLFLDETFIGNDAVALTRLGKNLIENGKYSFGENYNWGIFFPPGYPFLVGIINLFLNDLFLSGKLISLFSSIMTIFLFYLIGKELYNEEAGLFSAFIYAIHPVVLGTQASSVRVATDPLFFCLLFLTIYLFMVSIRRNSFFIFTLLGISIGMSYLIRPEGVFLLLLPFLSVNGCNPFKNMKNFLKVSVTFLIFILIASPYLLFLKDSTGEFTLSGKGGYLAVLIESGVTQAGYKYDKTVYSLDENKSQLKGLNTNKRASIAEFIIKKPFVFIKGYIRNCKEGMKILSKLLIAILLPLFFSFFDKDLFKKKSKWILLFLSFLFFIIYPSFFILERHMYPIVFFLTIFSSVGFVHSKSIISGLLDFYKIRKNKIAPFIEKNIKYIIITICIVSGFIVNPYTSREVPVEHIKAGYFIRDNISPGYEKLNIMHRMPWISFYSDSKFTILPYARHTDVINFAKKYRVDYIVVDERVLKEWEYYDELINMEKYSDDVELIYENNAEKLIKLLKIRYKK